MMARVALLGWPPFGHARRNFDSRILWLWMCHSDTGPVRSACEQFTTYFVLVHQGVWKWRARAPLPQPNRDRFAEAYVGLVSK